MQDFLADHSRVNYRLVLSCSPVRSSLTGYRTSPLGNLNLLMTISYLRHEGTAGLLKILCAFLISLCSSPLCPWYSMCRTLGAHAHLSRTHFFETVSICIPNHNVTIRNKHSKTNCVNFFLLLQFDVVQKTTTNTTNMNEDSCRQRQICPQLFFCILLYCNYIYIYIYI